MTTLTFYCPALSETYKVKSDDRREAFMEANEYFSPKFEEYELGFLGWNPDSTGTVLTAKTFEL